MSLSGLAHTDPIGTSVGFFGIILAFVLYFRAKADVRLCYAIFDKHNLMEHSWRPLPAKAALTYDGRVIEELSEVIILIWNRGRGTLRSSDIASSDPLILRFTDDAKEAEVLEVVATHATREALGAGAAVDGNRIRLSFDFLACMDGFALKILYAGSANAKIECLGTLKGTPRSTRRYEPDPLAGGEFTSRFFLVRAGCLVLGLILASSIALPFLVEHLIKLPANGTGLLWIALTFFFIASFTIFSMYDFRQSAVPYEIRRLLKKFATPPDAE
jgi:hypothetical protein